MIRYKNYGKIYYINIFYLFFMIENYNLDGILEYVSKNNITDIHLSTNKKIYIRNNSWDIQKVYESRELELNDLESIVKELVWKDWFENFKINKELDVSYNYKSIHRYRVNTYLDSKWISIAMRVIPSEIPSMESLGLWDQIKDMCKKWKGLILVTWPTGSWKSTNMAAMIDYINQNYSKHIITIEDPIEFWFTEKKSLINQRELWSHTNWFSNALKSALREDPDVIMLWEMRDPETIKTAITLAETGHLVISTLHTNDSVQTIDRIVDVFPWNMQGQIRMQLSQSLVGIISQRLLPRIDKEWRIPAREILISNDAIRNLIIRWQTHQLYSVLEIWKNMWMILMDRYLLALYNKNIISKEILLSNVRDKESINLMIK